MEDLGLEQQPAYEPFINEDPAVIEQIYHMARSGAAIEYQGFAGDELAVLVAYDLMALGHAQAKDWVIDLYLDRITKFEQSPDDIEGSVDAARSFYCLRKLGYGLDIARTANIVDCAVENGVFETKILGTTPGDASRMEIQYKIAVLYPMLYMHNNGFILPEDGIKRGIDGIFDTIQRGLATTNNIFAAYNSTKHFYGDIFEHIPEDLIDHLNAQTISSLEVISKKYDYYHSAKTRAASINALADLCEFDTSSKQYLRRARRIQSIENRGYLPFIDDTHEVTEDTDEALRRLGSYTPGILEASNFLIRSIMQIDESVR